MRRSETSHEEAALSVSYQSIREQTLGLRIPRGRHPGRSVEAFGTDKEMKERMSRVLASLSLIESSLDELAEKTNDDQRWRDFYKELIPILDGIDAVRRAIEREGDPSWKRGMEIFSDRLAAHLEAHGLLQAARVGMRFDPSRHEAVDACDTKLVAPGTVAEVVENGWLYGGHILRYAKVIVAREVRDRGEDIRDRSGHDEL